MHTVNYDILNMQAPQGVFIYNTCLHEVVFIKKTQFQSHAVPSCEIIWWCAHVRIEKTNKKC